MVSYDRDYDVVDRKDPYTFSDTLTIMGYLRGRSSVQICLVGSKGEEYSMFISDFMDMVLSTDIQRARITGTWTFTKKGANYGLKKI